MNEIEYRRLVSARVAAFLTIHSPAEVEAETAIPASSMSHIKRGGLQAPGLAGRQDRAVVP